jgi:biotin carboxyl carrier protein
MNKILLLVVFSLILLGIPNAHARNSAASYDSKYYSQQEFVEAYNNSSATVNRDYIVQIDTTPSINTNKNLGQYVTDVTAATPNVYAFGVADENITAGTLGRFCIRGPHKIVVKAGQTVTAGTVLGFCSNNPAGAGLSCTYNTPTGTSDSMIGFTLNATATTDTGDVNNATGAEYWSWVAPQVLR